MSLTRRRPPGARFSTWHAPDGWAHRRMDWSARGKPRGTLLFAGGRGDFIEKYLAALHHWRRRGWNVTAFDWRGQGGSGGAIVGGNLDSFDPWIGDLEALAADVREAGPAPHVLIAHSMGGHLLLRALAERRVAPDAAVLTAPMIEVNSAPLPSVTAGPIAEFMCLTGVKDMPMWRTPPRGTPWWDRRRTSLTRSAELYEDELYWWDREPEFNIGPPSWGWMRAAHRSAADWFGEAQLSGLAVPILILGAERDRLVSAAAIRRVAALLPRAELFMYPEAAHELLREADDVRLDALARIDAFLDRETAKGKAHR
jgi:lysophospholipase